MGTLSLARDLLLPPLASGWFGAGRVGGLESGCSESVFVLLASGSRAHLSHNSIS